MKNVREREAERWGMPNFRRWRRLAGGNAGSGGDGGREASKRILGFRWVEVGMLGDKEERK